MATAISDDDTWTSAPTGPATGDPRTSVLIRGHLGEIGNRTRWLYNRLAKSLLGSSFSTFAAGDVDTGTDRITISGHGLVTGDILRYLNVGGTAIAISGAALTLAEGYSSVAFYAIVIDANTIQIESSSGGGALNITDAGSGTHYFFKVPSAGAAPMYKSFLVGGVTIVAGTLVNQMRQFLPLAGGTLTGTLTVDASTGAISMGGTKRLSYASRSLTRVQKALLVNATLDTVADAGLVVQKNDVGSQALALPNGSTLTAFSVYHNRTNTGVLPATRLQVGIKKLEISTGTASDVVALTEDPEAVIAAYEAHHAITISGLSEVIDNTAYKYYLNFVGETDPNGANTTVYPCVTTVTMTSDDEHP